jgi:hypothetical protein
VLLFGDFVAGRRKGWTREREKNLQKRKLSARFGFQHEEKEDDNAQNTAHDNEIKSKS